MNKSEWEEYCQKSAAMRERGVQVGDVLTCDEGAQPTLHTYTGSPCVRIMEYCLLDGTGPRFFIHEHRNGLVAFVPDEVIPPGTKFRVTKETPHSVTLERVE